MTRFGGTDWYALTAPLPWQTARLTASRIHIGTLAAGPFISCVDDYAMCAQLFCGAQDKPMYSRSTTADHLKHMK